MYLLKLTLCTGSTNLFGQQPQPSTSGGMFGTAGPSTFGQQNKPSGFGFGSTGTTVFGQQPQQVGTGLFQPSTSTVFGSSGMAFKSFFIHGNFNFIFLFF